MTDHGRRLDPERYLSALESDGEALARAAETDLDADVPGCPGWNLEELVWHTGGVYWFWGSIAGGRLQDPGRVERPKRPSRDELLDWYRTTHARLVDALRSGEPTADVWTWTAEHSLAWIRRRMAHETAVHAWDARSAVETPSPIERDLAVDGIDEFLEFFVTNSADVGDVGVHLHATDADGEWLAVVRDGKLDVRHEHAKGDVAVRGTASNLLLLLWGRIPEADVEVHGDRAALFRFLRAADLD